MKQESSSAGIVGKRIIISFKTNNMLKFFNLASKVLLILIQTERILQIFFSIFKLHGATINLCCYHMLADTLHLCNHYHLILPIFYLYSLFAYVSIVCKFFDSEFISKNKLFLMTIFLTAATTLLLLTDVLEF